MTGLERADESTVDADLDTLKEGEVSGIAPDTKLQHPCHQEIIIWRHLWEADEHHLYTSGFANSSAYVN